MNATLTKHQGPISLGLLVALTLLLGLLAYVPVQERFARYDFELQRDGRQLQRLQSIEASRDELLSNDLQFHKRGLDEWVYDARGGLGSIGLDIQRRVTSAIVSNDGELRSITPLPAQRRGDGQVVGVRVNFSSSMPVLLASLQALEQDKPLLMIEDFRINPIAQRSAKAVDGGEQKTEVQMSVVTLLPLEAVGSGAAQ